MIEGRIINTFLSFFTDTARKFSKNSFMLLLRTFALIVSAQSFCAGNATVICHASLRLAAPEDKHGVENAGGKNPPKVEPGFRRKVR